MEFKVIFAGFALHCVLNAVLICKSVVTKGQDELGVASAKQEEKVMFRALADESESMKRFQAEGALAQSHIAQVSR